MSKIIPLSVPNIKGNELKYITYAVETEWVSTAGEYVNDFEEKVAEYVKVKSAVSCQNGTAGLHLALMLCGVQREDEVIVPTLTFIAAVNPVKYIGAEPVFMDCDESLCMDMEKLQTFCEHECSFINGNLINKKTGRRIKAVIVVHVFGNMADMERLTSIAAKYQLKIIEDATEALGTYYQTGKYNGSFAGTIGDVGVYSFNGNKIITTGGGGMIVSSDEELLNKARYLSTQAKDDVTNFIHNEVGYNYRMTNLQAALGVAQLEQLEAFIETKKRNYEIYAKELNRYKGLRILNFREETRPNYWFYSLLLDDSNKDNRNEIIKRLQNLGIQTRPVWGLIHEQKPYKESQTYEIERAIYYYQRIINLPCSSNLKEEDVYSVVKAIKEII